MSGEKELKPCPFCGGAARLQYDDSSDYRSNWDWQIDCSNEACFCSFGHHDTEEKAIEAWNRRATTPGTEIVPEGTGSMGKHIRIGDFTISEGVNDGCVWIFRQSGEGGSFSLDKLERHIESFFREHF